jgi:UDP-glucose 4-epimerase
MKVLVTGVAGFIGSHLAGRLLQEGFQVIGIDSFLDNYSRKIKGNNLRGLFNNKFSFIEGSIFELDLKEILKKVDTVFHQAAIPGVRTSWGKEFYKYLENNVLATQILLESCKDLKIKKFIYASSSSVYGDSDELPIKETSTTKPVSPYGVSKLAGEHLAILYFKEYGIPTVSLRYFTVYGPRQRPDMGFHKFIIAILSRKQIEIFGSGDQTRDFTFIDDVVEANLLASNKGREGEVYNIGGGNRIELIQAIKAIEEVSGKQCDLKFTESQKGDVKRTYADISKAKMDFDYNPKIDINKGLEKHYEWLRENLDIYR